MAYRLATVVLYHGAANESEVELYQTEHAGKLENVPSISTCCLLNPACLARMMNGAAVCSQCFSNSLLSFRKGLKLTTSKNFYILNGTEIKNAPRIKWTKKMLQVNHTRIVRIESFGDVASVQQAINYIRIIQANPDCNFGVWTKNLNFWVQAFRKVGKPKNMTLVFSSLELNKFSEIPEWARPWVDHRFTVFTKEWLTEHGMCSNCAGISCAMCQRCYRKDTEFDIIEILRPKKKKGV